LWRLVRSRSGWFRIEPGAAGRNGDRIYGLRACHRREMLEMLKEIAPGIKHVVILTSDNPISSVVLPLVEPLSHPSD